MSMYKAVSQTSRLLSNVKHLIGNAKSSETKTIKSVSKGNTNQVTQLSDLEYNFKLRHIRSAQDALKVASDELDILADLFEAHFVPTRYEELQYKAIELARNTAEALKEEVTPDVIQELIAIDCERLSQLMLDLKRYDLTTSSKLLWSDIMRPSARVISIALKRYHQIRNTEANHNSTNTLRESLNITYTAAQRQLLTDMH